ncbi:Hypp7954 [Branchiostoma lanceolatum]|uniref:Hypp7954 protein n=1 Tax=Branchiostoma lanceolatum TaxID=7740 RepID=A0A8J9Z614_BRALA|nr:Hypp7954 [Branchiostoma lanceolatum]
MKKKLQEEGESTVVRGWSEESTVVGVVGKSPQLHGGGQVESTMVRGWSGRVNYGAGVVGKSLLWRGGG